MRFVEASVASQVAFALVVTGVLAAVLWGAYAAAARADGPMAGRRAFGQLSVILAGWLVVTSAPVVSGVLAQAMFPRVPLMFASVNLAAVGFGLSPLGGRMARGLPTTALVAFQTFRLPLELVLHSWAAQGTVPETMTWTGSNYDIVSGVLALVAAPFCDRSRALAWLVNVVGGLLLVNVARVAMMSSPLPFAWQVEPPLLLILYMPYALIGTVCVAGAVAGHVILTRHLLLRR